MNKNTIAEGVKRARAMRGMSLRALGEGVHLSKDTFHLLERNDRKVSLATLMAVADFLDVSLDYLLMRSDDPTWFPRAKKVESEETEAAE